VRNLFCAQKLPVPSNKAWLSWRIFINLLTSGIRRCLAIVRFFLSRWYKLQSLWRAFGRHVFWISIGTPAVLPRLSWLLEPLQYFQLHWPPSFHTLSNLRLSTIQTGQHAVRFTDSFNKLTIHFLNPPGRVRHPPNLLFDSFLQVKLPGSNVVHPPPSSAEVKNGWSCRPTSISPSRLHEADRETV
jgi:hypothetical protein